VGGNILSFLRKGEKAYGNATAWGLWASGRRPPFQILYSDDIFMFLGRVLITEKKTGFRRFILGTGRCRRYQWYKIELFPCRKHSGEGGTFSV